MRLLLALLIALSAIAQTPADLYALEEYHAWLGRQSDAVRRSGEALDKYREHLIERGLDHADADSQILAIREQEAEEAPPPCLVTIVNRLRTGKALDGTGNGAWLSRRGWKVSAWPAHNGKWDLVILRTGQTAQSPHRIRALLLPGGKAVTLDGSRCVITR
ncbi:MAG TPA: hypothetical protein VFQ91_06020 [Bryobacteraceae bacterium]|nr:hypothetical protein [Bryobacteraceae bacterium]